MYARMHVSVYVFMHIICFTFSLCPLDIQKRLTGRSIGGFVFRLLMDNLCLSGETVSTSKITPMFITFVSTGSGYNLVTFIQLK